MRHTWLAERGVTRFFGDPTPIQQDYHVPDFVADHGGLPITKSVHVQCGVAVEDAVLETCWVQAQADQHGLVGAIVAFCDLTAEDADAQLAKHLESPLLRGVRQIVGRDAVEDAKNGTNALLVSAAFQAGLGRLATHNLSFDLQLTPPLLKAAAKVFAHVETVPVALCHAGSPQDFSEAGRANWAEGLRAFAELPHAICKISGLGMFDQNWTVESFRDRVLRTIDIFGPDRVAFGSNFPVDKLYADYETTMGAYLTLTDEFTPKERDAMFHDVAANFYRIDT